MKGHKLNVTNSKKDYDYRKYRDGNKSWNKMNFSVPNEDERKWASFIFKKTS